MPRFALPTARGVAAAILLAAAPAVAAPLAWTAPGSASGYVVDLRDGEKTFSSEWYSAESLGCADDKSCVLKAGHVPARADAWRYRPIYGSKKGAWSGFETIAQSNDRVDAGGEDAEGTSSAQAAVSIVGRASAPAAVGGRVPRIPAPLPKLRVYQLEASGVQKVSGGPDEDLLLVSPKGTIDGAFRIEVDGFRGVYWIGGSLNPAPIGWLNTPKGQRVEGVGSLVRIRTHANAQGRPFIVLGRLKLDTDKITFGDFIQVGGAAKAGDWGDWPDVWRCRIKAEPLYGWSGYYGGSFSKYVSHSDFTKFETGGVRHSYAAKIDVAWGYQGEFVLPSYASNKRPYAGPDGYGTAHYWNYVARVRANPGIGAKATPIAFFLARGSKEVAAGDHLTYVFHDGVYLDAPGAARRAVMPAGGAYGVREGDGYLTWPSPNGRDFVQGRIERGDRSTVGDGEVGSKHRVTDRAGLVRTIKGLCD